MVFINTVSKYITKSLHIMYIHHMVCVRACLRARVHGVHIIYAKFKNDRAKDNGDAGCMKMEKNFFYFREEF